MSRLVTSRADVQTVGRVISGGQPCLRVQYLWRFSPIWVTPALREAETLRVDDAGLSVLLPYYLRSLTPSSAPYVDSR